MTETTANLDARGTPGRHPARWSRTTLLRMGLALPATLLLAACGDEVIGGATAEGEPEVGAATDPEPATAGAAGTGPAPADQAGVILQPTPECADADDLTPAQTEGPYFKRSSPERASLLEPGMSGTRLVLTGWVLGTNCRPVARALLDFWQADDRGDYDNAGYRLRGHQFTDESGRYTLETVVPGLYPGRTRHIHVKVQAPNRPVLTTQLYFPGEPRNANDGIFHRDLVMAVQDAGNAKAAAFNFVLNIA